MAPLTGERLPGTYSSVPQDIEMTTAAVSGHYYNDSNPSQPSSHSSTAGGGHHEEECGWECVRLVSLGLAILTSFFFGVQFMFASIAAFHPHVHVVSALMSTINVTAGGTRLITADWAVTLDVRNSDYYFHLDAVQAAVFQAARNSRPLATTRQFSASKPDLTLPHEQMTVAIQFSAREEPVEGSRVGSSDFGVLVLAWVHLDPVIYFPRRSYFARITCRPLWIGPFTASAPVGSYSDVEPKECDAQVILQEQVEKNWTRLAMTDQS